MKKKRIIRFMCAVLVVVGVLVCGAFLLSKYAYKDLLVKHDYLLENGPWERGGIWASDDGNYYLVSIEDTPMVYMYAQIDETWINSGFCPDARTIYGACVFYAPYFQHLNFNWKASYENESLIVKTRRSFWVKPDELMVSGNKIVFKRTDLSYEDLPFDIENAGKIIY